MREQVVRPYRWIAVQFHVYRSSYLQYSECLRPTCYKLHVSMAYSIQSCDIPSSPSSRTAKIPTKSTNRKSNSTTYARLHSLCTQCQMRHSSVFDLCLVSDFDQYLLGAFPSKLACLFPQHKNCFVIHRQPLQNSCLM